MPEMGRAEPTPRNVIPAQPGIVRRPLELLWDVRSASGEAMALLAQREPTIAEILDDVVARCPVSETARPFEGEHFERPRGHARSFSLRLSAGVLVFKGTEPFSLDYPDVLEEAWRKRELGRFSPMDHFAIVEDEVYLSLTKRLALGCAEQTWDWVNAHTSVFRELPHTPCPLLVLQVPEGVTTGFRAILLPLLSDCLQLSAREKVDGFLADGLGVYVYYYPGTPVRLAHALGDFPGSFGVGVDDEATTPIDFDIDSAVASWTDLFARMLVAGFVPTTPIHTGNCLQSQNVAIDGGLCDVDSLVALSSLRHTRDLASALSFSLEVLTETVVTATALPYHFVSGYLWQEIARRTRETARGTACDPRISRFVELEGLAGLRWLSGASRG
ncbi:hypothetical protein [Mycolicibacterium rhodesiae]|uniref:hypothetical protein n=1 Tax=Mycolicibacterium rhodesiae TaxID=36814 RepID=UPI001301935E|nr:hypothetical protein [Mycolicibacterium rhodesiae]